jgi:hypothetical protein
MTATENPNNNFFDDLERQLVTATGDRPRRLRRARTRRVATLCTMLVALLAVGGGLAAALSNGGDSTDSSQLGRPAQQQQQPPPAPARTTPALPKRETFEVAVLNGATTPGLARGVAMRLQNMRFKIGTVTNAPTHDHVGTYVYYATPNGFGAAAETAEALGTLVHHQPRPAPRGLRVVAGDGATVIVVAGSGAADIR